MFFHFHPLLLGKFFQTLVWQVCVICQISDLINCQNNVTRPNSNNPEFSIEPGLKYKIIQRYAKKPLHSLGSCTETPNWYRCFPFYLSISPVLWHKCQRMFSSWLHLSKACWEIWLSDEQPHFYNNVQWETWRQFCKVPKEELKIGKYML